MKALGERGCPVPVAVAHNRHAVLMSLVDGVPLVQVRCAQPLCTCPSDCWLCFLSIRSVSEAQLLRQADFVHCCPGKIGALLPFDVSSDVSLRQPLQPCSLLSLHQARPFQSLSQPA